MAIVSRLKPPDAKIERRIITAMIVSSEFLKQVQKIYKPQSLKTQFAKTVASWCVEFYQEFSSAPGRHIQDIFHAKTKLNFQGDKADDIKEFLSEISDEYETADTLNIEYLLKQTEHHFRLNNLDHTRVELGKAIIGGNPDEGESRLKNFERTVRQQTDGIDIFRDKDSVITTFGDQEHGNKIIQFPGEFGKIIGPLEREYLVVFVGNTGVGKSWWLSQCAWWLVMAGFNVLYVSFEMSKSQCIRRAYQWATGLPTKTKTVFLPVWDCAENQQNTCKLQRRACSFGLFGKKGALYTPGQYPAGYKPCTACKGVNDRHRFDYHPTSLLVAEERQGITLERGMQMRNLFERSQKRAGSFDFIRWPGRQKSIDDLRLHLSNVEDYKGKTYDCIITDYASKMCPSRQYKEMRHGVAEVFIDHKALAQEKNCLVLTGHQGNTVRDDKDLGRGSWQESIAGLNEADVSILINQQQKEKMSGWSEKSSGIFRLSPGKIRDEEYDVNKQIYILSCLGIGRPYIDSYVV